MSRATQPRAGARRRPWVAVAVGLALALLVLELCLQAWALVVWFGRTPPPAQAQGAPAILCVGDSFTFGIGASSRAESYPSQLERLLRADGTHASVINEGWPGQSSAIVLRRLGAHLHRHRPRLVYVLAGYNDQWDTTPEVFATDAEDAGFPIQWRTRRLLTLLLNAWRTHPADADAPFVGQWHDPVDGASLVIERDGRLFVDGAEMRWVGDGPGRLAVTFGELPAFPLTWRRDGARLVAAADPWLHTLEPGPLPPTWRSLIAGRDALARGAWSDAAREFAACVADAEYEAPARSGLARALAPTDPAAADEQIAVLQRLHTERPDARTASALASALLARDRRDEIVDLTCAHLARTGSGRGLLGAFLHVLPTAAQTTRLVQALRGALAHEPAPPAKERAEVWRALASLNAGDPMEATRCLLAAARLDGAIGDLPKAVQISGGRVNRAVCERLVGEIATTPDERDRLRGLLGAVFGDDDQTSTPLLRHLRRIIALCREHAAEPVLLDYPRGVTAVTTALQRCAKDLGVGTVAVQAAFEHAQRTEPGTVLILPGRIHCTDAGYALMARTVAADAQRRLR